MAFCAAPTLVFHGECKKQLLLGQRFNHNA